MLINALLCNACYCGRYFHSFECYLLLLILSVCVCVLPELFCNAALCLLYYALDKMDSLSCFVGHTIGQLLAHTCPLDNPRAGGLCRLQHGLSLLLPRTLQPDIPLRTKQSLTHYYTGHYFYVTPYKVSSK